MTLSQLLKKTNILAVKKYRITLALQRDNEIPLGYKNQKELTWGSYELTVVFESDIVVVSVGLTGNPIMNYDLPSGNNIRLIQLDTSAALHGVYP